MPDEGNAMTRKWMIGAVMVGVLAACVYDAAANMEIRISGEGMLPGNDDDWDIGYGASAQVIFWSDTGLGFALSAGVQKWDINDEVTSYGEYLGGGYGYGYAAGLQGDAMMIPLGASALYRVALGQTASLTLEGGLRYVIVNSSVEFVEAEAIADRYGNVIAYAQSYDIDIDNGLVGVLGADFEMEVSPGFRLFAGAGYQFDVMKGDTTIGGVDLDYENELKALYFRAGLAFAL